ncbi:lipase family protein [Kiritimatiellaeota bacterium B1221]|nr:lipase family protein [Kiritimatiellaeota bacterium B1221]
MKKEIPHPKNYDVIPPDMGYRYFENGAQFPLQPAELKYTPVNAWWFAEFSFLAYCHPGFVRMAVKLAGFDGFFFVSGKGTECMVSWNHEVCVIAFRGTELKSRSALHEVKTDLNALPVAFEKGGKVHGGFLAGLEEVWGGENGLEQKVQALAKANPQRPIWITGHSLGGALAALCFARLPAATGLYLYGSPRVGDQTFIQANMGRPIFRIENATDPVPLVPPDIPKLKFNFGDLGELRFLDWQGKVLKERPVFVLEHHKEGYREAKEMLDEKFRELTYSVSLSKAGFRTSKKLIKELDHHHRNHVKEWRLQMKRSLKQFGLNLDEHQPIFYAVKTWNALMDAESNGE